MGSFLYTLGGFNLPFFVVGTFSLVVSFGLFMVVPDIGSSADDRSSNNNNNDDDGDDGKKPEDRNLSFLSFMKVSFRPVLLKMQIY